jgi:hypothetical protein
MPFDPPITPPITTKRAVIAAISIAVLTQLNISGAPLPNTLREVRGFPADMTGATIVSKMLDRGVHQ